MDNIYGNTKYELFLKDAIKIYHIKEAIEPFDEKIAEEIIALEDEEITKNYDANKWEHLKRLSDGCIALRIALVKSKYFPQEMKDNIIKNLDDIYMKELFNSKYLSFENVKFICERALEWSEDQTYNQANTILHMNARNGNISDTMLHHISRLSIKELEKMHFFPFEFISYSSPNFTKLLDLLENKNEKYFKGGVHPELVTAVINNKNLSIEMRNKMLKEEYIMHWIYNHTYESFIETYKSAKEAFEMPTDDDNFYAVNHAYYTLCDFIEKGYLNEEKQMECLELALKKIEYDEYFVKMNGFPTRLIQYLLKNTKDKDLINMVINTKNKDYVMFLKNNQYLDEETRKKCLNIVNKKDAEHFAFYCLKDLQIKNETYQKYLKEDSKTAKLLFMAELSTPERINNQITEEETNAEFRTVLCCMKTLKKYLDLEYLDITDKGFKEDIMFFFLDSFVKQNKSLKNKVNIKTKTLEHIIKNQITYTEKIINPENYKDAYKVLADLKEMYPEQKKILSEVSDKIYDKYGRCELLYKHKELQNIDFKELDKKTDEELKEMIKDIKEEDNVVTVDHIKIDMKCNLRNCPIDEIYKYIYRFADMYNVLSKELTFAKKEEQLINDDSIALF